MRSILKEKFMFKKSNNKGDKTPKKESKDHAAKTESAADKPAPAEEKKTAPANDEK